MLVSTAAVGATGAASIGEYSGMSLAEIKAELPKLTPEERAALAQELQNFLPFNDPDLMARIETAIDDAERGEKTHSKDELFRRLRAAGREVLEGVPEVGIVMRDER